MKKLILVPLFFVMACTGVQPGTTNPSAAIFSSMLPFLGCAMTGKISVIVNSVDGTVTPMCAPADIIPISCPSGKYEATYNVVNGKYDFKCLDSLPETLGGDVLLTPTE